MLPIRSPRFDPKLLHNQPRDGLLLDRSHQQPIRLRPLEFSLVRVHFPPRPGPPGPGPPSSSGGAGAIATQFPCHLRRCPERSEREKAELTKDNHEAEEVNPILLYEAFLWFGHDNFALGREWWRGAQLRPRVAFDQIPDYIHVCHLSPQRTNQTPRPDLVG